MARVGDDPWACLLCPDDQQGPAGEGLTMLLGVIEREAGRTYLARIAPEDDRVVTLEELRRELETAVAQAGIECEAKHVALNELKALKAKVRDAAQAAEDHPALFTARNLPSIILGIVGREVKHGE